jgi:hypothetical protein
MARRFRRDTDAFRHCEFGTGLWPTLTDETGGCHLSHGAPQGEVKSTPPHFPHNTSKIDALGRPDDELRDDAIQ